MTNKEMQKSEVWNGGAAMATGEEKPLRRLSRRGNCHEPDYPSLTAGTHVVERKDSCRLSSDLCIHAMAQEPTLVYTRTHIIYHI